MPSKSRSRKKCPYCKQVIRKRRTFPTGRITSRSRRRKRSKKRKSRRRRKRSKSRSRSRRRSKRVYMTLARCKAELKEKIKINMREYNDGKYANRKQAIAIAYSQIQRKYPQCKGKI